EAVGVSVIAAHLVTGYTPLSRAFAWPVTTGQEPAIHAALAQVPAAAPASLEMHMGAHGARRDMLRIFPDTRDVTWIALNVWLGENPYGPTTLDALKVLVDAPNWSVVEAREGIVVLQHGSGPPRDLVKAFDPTSRLLLAPVDVAFTSGAPALNLQGLSVTQLPVGHFNVCSDWNVTDAEDLLPSLTLGPTQIPGASSATLDVVPWLASQPEPLTNVRVCTHLVTKLARFEVTLKVQVHDAAGAAVPVHIVDEGAWNGSLDAVADGVVFRIPIGW
ncbi:MAG: hypothetical protein JXB35_06665, partial [Anaerolineae bacterium]|nr:hypothetical protein [Anaerolineae bacterium]